MLRQSGSSVGSAQWESPESQGSYVRIIRTAGKPMVHCPQWVLLRGSLRNLKVHKLGKTDVFKVFQIFQDTPR